MSEEDYKDLGKIKNKWIETKDEYLDMSLNIIEKLNPQIKQQKELIDKIKEMCIQTEKHNDNCGGALDYEIIESNILDLIKEYEDENNNI